MSATEAGGAGEGCNMTRVQRPRYKRVNQSIGHDARYINKENIQPIPNLLSPSSRTGPAQPESGDIIIQVLIKLLI